MNFEITSKKHLVILVKMKSVIYNSKFIIQNS
jgi:hypothetical protein